MRSSELHISDYKLRSARAFGEDPRRDSAEPISGIEDDVCGDSGALRARARKRRKRRGMLVSTDIDIHSRRWKAARPTLKSADRSRDRRCPRSNDNPLRSLVARHDANTQGWRDCPLLVV